MAEEHDHSEEHEHIVSISIYLAVFGALVVLTITTFLVARIDMGSFNIVVALFIAGVKASLVALIFMHLKYSNKTLKLVMGASIFWLVLLIGLSLNDYLTRGLRYPGVGPKPAATQTVSGENR
ncbi:MAG: cytochrome C oxidase subunit IV family protein [Blastocatellia bacterium]